MVVDLNDVAIVELHGILVFRCTFYGLQGTVKNETQAFLPSAVNSSFLLKETVRLVYGKQNLTRILQAYDNPRLTPFEELSLLSTDSLATCYTRHTARLLASSPSPSSSPVHLYQFLHGPSAHADPTNAKKAVCTSQRSACHAGDNVFVFGTQDLIQGVDFLPQERVLSDAMVLAWTTFAKGGQDGGAVAATNGGAAVWQWPGYDAASDVSTAWLSGGPTKISGYHSQNCDMWDSIGYQLDLLPTY
jgi:carboxylesterase type B